MIKYSAFAAFSLTLLPACPLLEVEATITDVCVTKDVEVPGVDAGTTSIATTITYDDLSAFAPVTTLEGNVEFVRGEARALSGITDFGFVRSARLTLASGDLDSTLPTLSVANCDGDCFANGASLELPGDQVVSVIDYVKASAIVADVEVNGELPAYSWSMAVDVCMKGAVSASFEL